MSQSGVERPRILRVALFQMQGKPVVAVPPYVMGLELGSCGENSESKHT